MKQLNFYKNCQITVSALFLAAMFSCNCFCNELSLNGIVPAVGNADGYGWTAGSPIGGILQGDDIEMFTGFWAPPMRQNGTSPQIATNALIFPEVNSIIFAAQWTNIIWDVEKITDDIDGTNLTVSKITLHYADTTNEILSVTNNIDNTLGEIEWFVPAGSWDGETNYVLNFEVIDSSSLTNSRIFWDNKFVIVPEPGIVIGYLLSVIGIFIFRLRK